MVRNKNTGFKSFLLPAMVLLLLVFGCKKDKPEENPVLPFERLQKDISVYSNLLKRNISYAVLLPAEYETGNDYYPVVYLLHGFGDNEKAWYQGGNIRYYADQYISETGPVIFVMPQGFNTYWVNKYSGTYPYMDMFVQELMPDAESKFRIKREAAKRAVMGYSMGGYGALALTAKNPDLFNTAIVLSMSFRTDEQYLKEPQGVFDSQWGTVFGGVGKTGQERLTSHFISYSPFHFFADPDDPAKSGQNYFIDCGDDEESLSETNNSLHILLRNEHIDHEYRVRNGAHSWDYWHKSLPEAFRYLGYAFRNQKFPDASSDIPPVSQVSAERISELQAGETQPFKVLTPLDYYNEAAEYPVIYVLHDMTNGAEDDESQNLMAMFNANVQSLRLPKLLVVEIPFLSHGFSVELMNAICDSVKSNFRVKTGGNYAVIAGNGGAGGSLYQLQTSLHDRFNACLLFDASLPSDATVAGSALSWYLDITDKGNNYPAYHSFYMSLRETGVAHQYRVRQGLTEHTDFLTGLSEASVFIKDQLKK